MLAVGDPLNRIKRRYSQSSPTAFTDTIYDLVDAIEQLATMTAREYGVDALYGPRNDDSPEVDS